MSEPRDLYHGRALAIVKPIGRAQVAHVLALCNEHGVAVVPQGGNTGLVGGQTPDESGRQIVLSLQRLDRIRDVDPVMRRHDGGSRRDACARAGDRASRSTVIFPLSLASEGSCTIGGNLATNAGGVHVLAYGAARDLALGLEVALADGRLLSTLGKLRKDNTGYDLTQLFIGSEGTLGVITAATLKLFPRPRSRAVAFVGLDDPGAGAGAAQFRARITRGRACRRSNSCRASASNWCCATFPARAIRSRRRIPGMRSSRSPDCGGRGRARRGRDCWRRRSTPGCARDATLAHSLDQAAALWRLRESMSEAQKREGGSIKHDVSVPIERIPAFIDEAGDAHRRAFSAGAARCPSAIWATAISTITFRSPSAADKAGFLAQWDEMNDIVHGLVEEFGGSISAEHGIGRLKRDLLAQVKDPIALDVMRALKQTLDPNSLLNPGKLL